MSWLSDVLGGGGGEIKSAATTSKSQQELEKVISGYLSKYVGKGAEAYPGQLPGTADVPELFTQAYERYASQFGGEGISTAISDLISGKPAYTFDPKDTIKTWEETYASPIMETWKSTVMPALEEQYNVPGGFYSTRKGMGIGRAAGEFYGGQVAPTLYGSLQAGEQRGFESAEAAAARRPGALGLPGQQFAQAAQVAMTKMGLDENQLTAAFNEFLRTRAEPGWAAGAGMGLATTPTMENIYVGDSGIGGQLGQLGGMALGGYAGALYGGGFSDIMMGAGVGGMFGSTAGGLFS